MRKFYSILTAAVMVFSGVMYTSCKRKIHPTHPTPDNNRLLSYSKFSTSSIPGYVPVTETFTFYYDDNKRVTTIVYSSNDQVRINNGTAQMNIDFTYSNDTIYKTYTAIRIANVVERDTFVTNSSGQIVQAYFPGEAHTFEYFGKLIARDSKTVSDSGTYISGGSTYTSDNGDLLNHVYDGALHAQFPDMGINSITYLHESLVTPLTVTWTDFGTSPATIVTHTGTGYTDDYTGYSSGGQVMVQAIDGNGVIAYDTLFWPGGIWPREQLFVYPDLYDRPGDYMQIESFTTYGVNIYQNAHLIKYIYEQDGPKTEVLYTIDADSKVTQTYVTKTVSETEVYTTTYKLQYQVF